MVVTNRNRVENIKFQAKQNVNLSETQKNPDTIHTQTVANASFDSNMRTLREHET